MVMDGRTKAKRTRSTRGSVRPVPTNQTVIARSSGRLKLKRHAHDASDTSTTRKARSAHPKTRHPLTQRRDDGSRSPAVARRIRSGRSVVAASQARLHSDAWSCRPRCRVFEVGPRDGLQNEATTSRPSSSRSSRSSSPPGCGRSRPPASSRRGHPSARRCGRAPAPAAGGHPPASAFRFSSPTSAAWIGPWLPAPGGGRLHGGERGVHPAEHRDDHRRSLTRSGRCCCGRQAGLVDARVRIDRLRVPVHGRRIPGGSSTSPLLWTSASTRSLGDTIGVGVPTQVHD